MKRRGGCLNVYYYVQEANVEWLHTIWFHPCEILEKSKLKTLKKKKKNTVFSRD